MLFQERRKDGYGKGSTLGGICPRTQFIKEYEGISVCMSHDVYDVFHVGRKGGQALFYGLFIPYVGVYFIEYAQAAFLVGGNMETGLAHQGKKPHGL